MTILKIGSKGADVKTLQAKLNLVQDGIFGSVTEEAVREFQEANGLTIDGVVGNKTWEKLGVTNKRTIKYIIIHCSATPEGKDYTVADIRKWHLQRGFNDIGYHYIIYRDGSINKGRDESVIGAHCTGYNTYSIGVCYIGGVKTDCITPKDTRTDAQKASLIKLIKELKAKYPGVKVYSHSNF